MPGTNDRFFRERENFLAIISQRVFVGNVAAAHRTGKERVADDGYRSSEAGDDVGYSAARMARGQARLDFQRADFEAFAFRDRLRALFRFELRNVNRRISRLAQPPQIGHMIGMSVSEQNQSNA